MNVVSGSYTTAIHYIKPNMELLIMLCILFQLNLVDAQIKHMQLSMCIMTLCGVYKCHDTPLHIPIASSAGFDCPTVSSNIVYRERLSYLIHLCCVRFSSQRASTVVIMMGDAHSSIMMAIIQSVDVRFLWRFVTVR